MLAIVLEENFAYEIADGYWGGKKTDMGTYRDRGIWVNHRSAVVIDGKYHLVLKPSFKPSIGTAVILSVEDAK